MSTLRCALSWVVMICLAVPLFLIMLTSAALLFVSGILSEALSSKPLWGMARDRVRRCLMRGDPDGCGSRW